MPDYTGAVKPGGPFDTRTLPELTITKASVGPMDNNAYLLVSSGEGLLIDAAAEPDRLVELIGDVRVVTIVTTHQHGDHWQALADIAGRTSAELVAHPLDAPALPVPMTRLVENGDTVGVGSRSLRVIHLRGHTPGSIALRYDDPAGYSHLFTGDSLFPGGVGKTNSPETFGSLIDDVEQRIFAVLPDSTWVYPGHGNDTTLGVERPQLAEWRARGW